MCKRPQFIASDSNGRIITTTNLALSTPVEIFYHFYVVLGQNHRAKYTFFVAPFALKTPVFMRVPRHLWQNICYTYIYVKQTRDRYRPLSGTAIALLLWETVTQIRHRVAFAQKKAESEDPANPTKGDKSNKTTSPLECLHLTRSV